MALAIAATPMLSGKDAKRFLKIVAATPKFVPNLTIKTQEIEAAKRKVLEREQKHN